MQINDIRMMQNAVAILAPTPIPGIQVLNRGFLAVVVDTKVFLNTLTAFLNAGVERIS